MKQTIAIIGGGASGLMAAICLAQSVQNQNIDIVILEQNDRVGRKLLATGNGRCNLTNRLADATHYYGDDQRKIETILSQFDVDATLSFFESLGIAGIETTEGRIYPRSFQASSVLDALREACQEYGVVMQMEASVQKIQQQNNGYTLLSKAGQKLMQADVVLIAAGGQASPKLGSDGSGLNMMKKLGYDITNCYPVLVQMRTQTDHIRSLKGIKFEGTVALYHEDTCIGEQSGEVLFTEYGLSGSPVFGLSVLAGDIWRRDEMAKLELRLNFLPEMSEEELHMQLMMRASYLSRRSLQSYFNGLLNKRIGLAVLKKAGVLPLSRLCSDISKREFHELTRQCQSFILPAEGNISWNQAQAMAGGISLSCFKNTLESKHHAGLFAAGEVLDVVGDCGGYNLQWAWSSAAVAANGILSYLQKEKR